MDKLAYNLLQHYKTLGISRKAMPQLRGDSVSEFLKSLKGDGVEYKKLKMDPEKLKPTQKHIDSEKVEAFKGDVKDKHVVVARSGHILDGHHRWAKAMIDDSKLKVIQVDMPIRKLVSEAKEFNKAAAMEKIAVITSTETGFTVSSRSGRVLGTHPTREHALRQERAIAISKRAELAFRDELSKIAGAASAFEEVTPMIDDVASAFLNSKSNPNDKKQKQPFRPMQKLSEMSMISAARPMARAFNPNTDIAPSTTNAASSLVGSDGYNSPGQSGGVATI